MAVTQYWKHSTLIADEHGLATLQSPNPFGTHALTGAAWVGGDYAQAQVLNNNAGSYLQDGDVAPIIYQYTEYDPGTDTTFWTVAFRLTPGSAIRGHVGGFVEVP
jgi:hypothetical protein